MKTIEIIKLSLRALKEPGNLIMKCGLDKSSPYKKKIAQPVPSKAKESSSLPAMTILIVRSHSLFRAKRRNLLRSSRWHINYCVWINLRF